MINITFIDNAAKASYSCTTSADTTVGAKVGDCVVLRLVVIVISSDILWYLCLSLSLL